MPRGAVNAKKSSIAESGDTPRERFASGSLMGPEIRKRIANTPVRRQVSDGAERHTHEAGRPREFLVRAGLLHAELTTPRYPKPMTEELAPALDLGEARAEPKPKWATGIALGLIHLGALAPLLPMFFSWQAVLVAFVLYYLTGGVGITFCFHRMLTHRSLVVPKWLEYGTAIVGTLALQGGPIDWVSTHRAHHAYSDTERDPHNARRGFWWSHVLWLFEPNPARLTPAEELRFSPDLVKDPFYRVLDRIPLLLQIALGVVLFMLGGWPFVVWGIFVRLVVTYNVTWFVNSAAHMFGYRTYDAERSLDQ
jgi:fatty-acid desaturase